MHEYESHTNMREWTDAYGLHWAANQFDGSLASAIAITDMIGGACWIIDRFRRDDLVAITSIASIANQPSIDGQIIRVGQWVKVVLDGGQSVTQTPWVCDAVPDRPEWSRTAPSNPQKKP